MNFLSIDTSAEYLTVVAQKGERTKTRFLKDCARNHSVRLMEEIDCALKALDMSVRECDFFAVTVGPGSFTGIRIGISCVKGLCLATEKKALAITSFDTLAYAEKDEKLLCTVDAGHSYVYACGYTDKKITLPPRYCSLQEAQEYCGQGYRMIDSRVCDPAEGLLQAVRQKHNEVRPVEELAALYLRKSSAEENLR